MVSVSGRMSTASAVTMTAVRNFSVPAQTAITRPSLEACQWGSRYRWWTPGPRRCPCMRRSSWAAAPAPPPSTRTAAFGRRQPERMPLGWHEVHVWWMFPDKILPLSPDLREAYLSVLDPREALRHASGQGEGGATSAAEEWLLSRALLRSTLARYLGPGVQPQDLQLERNEHGKPSLASSHVPTGTPELQFNLTHSDSIIGCAVSLGRMVGLDAELTQRRTKIDPLRLAKRRFSPKEHDALQRLAETEGTEAMQRRFVDFWTLKEAYVKATGRGISAPPGLKGFSVGLEPMPAGERTCCFVPEGQQEGVLPAAHPWERISFSSALEGEKTAWQLLLMSPSERHTASLCLESLRGEEDISIRSFYLDEQMGITKPDHSVLYRGST